MPNKIRNRRARAPQGTLSNWVIPAMAAAFVAGAFALRAIL